MRFVHDLFPAADHLTLATNDEYGPQAAFLGEHRADRDPPHVSYVVDSRDDSATAQAVADHAYWVSGLRARDELVLDRLLDTGAAVVVVLAGGYAPDVVDTVDINAATVAAVAARDTA